MDTSKIPVIDFSSCGLLVKEDCKVDVDKERMAGIKLYEALSNVGFVYLMNSGINSSDTWAAMKAVKQFFEKEDDYKMQYRAASPGFGYTPANTARLNPKRPPDFHEAFCLSGSASGDLVWPDSPNFQQKIVDMREKCRILSARILRTLACGMKLKDRDVLVKFHQMMDQSGNRTTFKANYYPAVPDVLLGEDQARIGEHSDWGSITLLFQDQTGGLEVQLEDGSFVDAKPIPGSVLLNVGDMLQFWAGNAMRSAVHRVLIPRDPELRKKTRISLAYFAFPDNATVLNQLDCATPEPDATTDANHKNRAVTAEEYFFSKFSEHVQKF